MCAALSFPLPSFVPFGMMLVMGFSSSPKAVLLDPMEGWGVRAMNPPSEREGEERC